MQPYLLNAHVYVIGDVSEIETYSLAGLQQGAMHSNAQMACTVCREWQENGLCSCTQSCDKNGHSLALRQAYVGRPKQTSVLPIWNDVWIGSANYVYLSVVGLWSVLVQETVQQGQRAHCVVSLLSCGDGTICLQAYCLRCDSS